MNRLGSKLLATTLACALAGCFAVTDIDRFHTAKRGGSGQFDDLRFSVKAMTSHPAELFEFRVVDANNVIQSRGFLSPLGGVDVAMNAPLAIPKVNGPFRLDFYADHDGTGGYSGPDPKDHSWRIAPLVDFPQASDPGAASDGVVDVVFEHNRSFTDLGVTPDGKVAAPTDTGVPAVLRFTNMGPHAQKTLQARVRDGTGHTAGLYRVRVTQPSFELQIPGIVDAGVDYDVEIWIDGNGNGAYDVPVPGGDLGFRVRRPSDRSGMRLDFDPAAEGTGLVDVGPP